MRTTFSEMHLFNDTFSQTANIFYMQRKGVGGKQERGRERKKNCERRSVGGKGYGMGHKRDCWSSIYKSLETG
jgi:hypothetical protein